MTKEVLLSIKGLQTDFVSKDSLEMITTGTYYHKNDKEYINYIDNDLNKEKETKTTIKISEDKVDLIRFGGVTTHMIFEVGKNHMTHYNTPLGALLIGIKTKDIQVSKADTHLSLKIKYTIDINNNFISENTFELHAQNQQDSKVKL
ncbi:uncharacterized beta-barrel protein YwiB (DUF1934 family) [Natranaerovirga hydrolytica]|uniref:Uncharacterized beta-barrel protein YwiB (DUF1934 family) n=1 Tax=Natranaerovirga hydrolytica TaxID=680378 RepID=A0A4R1MKN7_9FIRM|nr:DUF1934 domain-containing protein [Natranaerovirga hydrolytica]TCK93296.1 uncharacterized beta-barrel protein YwiB (DUF1934 family) [Natranaerovirga hydrolytica]